MISHVLRRALCAFFLSICAAQTTQPLLAYSQPQAPQVAHPNATPINQNQADLLDDLFDEDDDEEEEANKSRWQKMKETTIDYYYMSKMLAKKYLQQQRVREILLASLAGVTAFGGGFGLGYWMSRKKVPAKAHANQNANTNQNSGNN